MPDAAGSQGRDRDEQGRPRSARPRDALGRPLPYGTPGVAEDPELARLEASTPEILLAAAQQLLDDERPFEAHELLEAGWKRAPESERALWRALAQLAVGMTHQLRGNDAGARALFVRSADTLENLDEAAVTHRIDARGLAGAARQLAAGQPVKLRLTQD